MQGHGLGIVQGLGRFTVLLQLSLPAPVCSGWGIGHAQKELGSSKTSHSFYTSLSRSFCLTCQNAISLLTSTGFPLSTFHQDTESTGFYHRMNISPKTRGSISSSHFSQAGRERFLSSSGDVSRPLQGNIFGSASAKPWKQRVYPTLEEPLRIYDVSWEKLHKKLMSQLLHNVLNT